VVLIDASIRCIFVTKRITFPPSAHIIDCVCKFFIDPSSLEQNLIIFSLSYSYQQDFFLVHDATTTTSY
jgi:hypothetical protein